jgi:hypothetical protein
MFGIFLDDILGVKLHLCHDGRSKYSTRFASKMCWTSQVDQGFVIRSAQD